MTCPLEFDRRRSLVLVPWGVLFLALATGCGARENSSKPGGATTPKAQEARKVAENSALEAVKIAADTQYALHPELHKKTIFEKLTGIGPTVTVTANVPTTPPQPAKPFIVPQQQPTSSKTEPPVRRTAREASPVVISERVVTYIPYRTEAEADERALKDAQEAIERRLRQQDPPIEYTPPLAVVRNEYIRRDSRLVRAPTAIEKEELAKSGYAEDRVYVEYTVELTAEQVRELRTRNRVSDGLRGLGVVAAVALAGFLFLRLDEWSKGYLTSWLALAAAALGGGIVALVVTA